MKRVHYFDIQDEDVPYVVYQLLRALRDYYGCTKDSILEIEPDDTLLTTWSEEQFDRVTQHFYSRVTAESREFHRRHRSEAEALKTELAEVDRPHILGETLNALRHWLQDHHVEVYSETVLVSI